LQIAFGTTTEPSKWDQGDKRWSTQRDITHLQALLRTRNKVLFTLDNGISDIYNVPIWAKATLNITFQLLNQGEKRIVANGGLASRVADVEVRQVEVEDDLSLGDSAQDAHTLMETRRRIQMAASNVTQLNDSSSERMKGSSQTGMPPAGLVIPLIEAGGSGGYKRGAPSALQAESGTLDPVRGKFSLAGRADG
jgi:hypothetical protein